MVRPQRHGFLVPQRHCSVFPVLITWIPGTESQRTWFLVPRSQKFGFPVSRLQRLLEAWCSRLERHCHHRVLDSVGLSLNLLPCCHMFWTSWTWMQDIPDLTYVGCHQRRWCDLNEAVSDVLMFQNLITQCHSNLVFLMSWTSKTSKS